MTLLAQIKNFLFKTNMSWKTALATSLSWLLCEWFGISKPVLAPLSAILCLQVTIDQSVKRAYQRMIGTVIGVIFTVLVTKKLGLNAWSVGLVVLAGSILGRLIRLSEQIIPQIAMSALLVFVFQHQNRRYSIERIEETIVGALVAILVNMLIFPPNYTDDAIRSVEKYTQNLNESFKEIADWMKKGGELKEGIALRERTQKLLADLHEIIDHMGRAKTSLLYNPFRKNSAADLERYTSQLLHLQQGYTHISGMLRIFNEWAATGKMTDKDRKFWANYLLKLSVYLEEWKGSDKYLEKKEKAKVEKDVHLDSRHLAYEFSEEIAENRFNGALYNDAIQFVEDFERRETKEHGDRSVENHR